MLRRDAGRGRVPKRAHVVGCVELSETVLDEFACRRREWRCSFVPAYSRGFHQPLTLNNTVERWHMPAHMLGDALDVQLELFDEISVAEDRPLLIMVRAEKANVALEHAAVAGCWERQAAPIGTIR